MSFSHRTKFLFIGSDKIGKRGVLINMTSTLERTEQVPPMDRFNILAGDIDTLRSKVEQVTTEQPIDELLEVIEVSDLATQFAVTPETMKRKLRNAGGKIFKIGKKYVIRKVKFLLVIEHLESC